MATADKLSYLLDTKAKIRDAVNDDILLIDDNTAFREYANKINSLSDTLKKYIPTEILEGTNFQIKDAVPLNEKNLVIDGNSYQKTTKGINLFNYLENIGDVSGLTITTRGDYIVINGTTSNNYQLVIKDIDITDILEDGEIYTLWQENDTKSSSSDTFPKTAIRLRAKHINGNYVYTRVTSSKTVNFSVNKSTFENYCIDVVTPISGEIYSNYKNKFMLTKGEYDEITIPIFEPFTGGIASPNPNYPQEIDFVNNLKLINRSNQLVDFSKNSDLTAGTTFYFENDVLNISCSNNRYSCVRYDILEIIKNNPSKILSFFCENYDFTNGNNPIVQIKYKLNEIIKYKTLFNDSKTKFSFIIPENVDDITSVELEIFSNNTGSITDSSISITKPILQFGTDKLEYDSYHKDEYSVDLKDNFLAKINDAKDELNIISGILDKNIQKYTFTGEENWIKSGLSNERNFVIALANDDLTNILKITKNNVICTYFILSGNLNTNGSFWLYNWSSSKQMYDALRFSFDINEIDSVEKAKNFFKNNEVTICYQSISQTVQLEPLKIKMYDGTNNIELSSNLETSMQLEYYKDYKANSEVASEVTE